MSRMIPRVWRPFWTAPGLHRRQIELRRYSWLNPRSRFNKNPPAIIIEDDENNEKRKVDLIDLKHYLKTTEIPRTIRMDILSSKLSALVLESETIPAEALPTLNAVFMQLFKSNDGMAGILEPEELLQLFEKSAQTVLSTNTDLPEYLATMAHQYLKSNQILPARIYVLIVALGSSSNSKEFTRALGTVLQAKRLDLPVDFTTEVLTYFSAKGLGLLMYENIMGIKVGDLLLVNDEFCLHFIKYVELIFSDSNPEVHQYKDMNKNVYRIQDLAIEILFTTSLDKLSMETLLQMLKLVSDLSTVVENENAKKVVQKILDHITIEDSDKKFQQVVETIFRQDLMDESLSEALLNELSRNEAYLATRKNLCSFIIADDVKFSLNLRLQAQLLSELTVFQLEDEVFELVESICQPHITAGTELDTLHNKIVQSVMLAGAVSPRGEFTELLDTYFASINQEPSLYAFQYRMDRAIALGDHIAAINIFEDSILVSSVQWNHCDDPSVALTFNKLIVLICEKMGSIMDIFPLFRKVKLHMTTQCNADAINALATKMLNEECVGDTIEMLKRELPKIEKDSISKIPVMPHYAYAYRSLFNLLHLFVITYNGEETHETNWVLYGELHKYFHVPYDTYMPALKYFCEKDRLNAALVIFRQVKMLNETHGSHHNPPPLREMYMYLLRTFGDRLYEEGVIEVHEYLKMDVGLQSQDITLQNCVLNAYSNLQNVGKAKDLFLSMSSNSKQVGGINEETVQIMIKTYTYSDMLYVKKFWNNLSQFGVFPDYAIFKQYVVAHVYHGFVEDAFKLVSEIDDYNIEYSSDLLLAMHNFCLDTKKQEEVVKWAVANHKEDWEQLKQGGLLRAATNYMPDANLITSGKTTKQV